MDMKAHLLARGMNPDRYQMSWSDEEETACFYLFNLSGQMCGYQQYRPRADKTRRNDPKEGRYYTYVKDKLVVWGMETFYYRNDILFLTEGVFDSVMVHNQNLPSIAVLANDPKHLRSWFRVLRQTRRLVAICDNDEAGRRLAAIADEALVVPTGKDLNDMTNDQVREFLKEYI